MWYGLAFAFNGFFAWLSWKSAARFFAAKRMKMGWFGIAVSAMNAAVAIRMLLKGLE
jgi:TRAP-type C4-dicarboxylate transport system permease small subunit